jgi:hypothetical protein
VVKERDELRSQIALRTAERDSLQASLVQFSRDLQSLASKIEQAAQSASSPPPVSASPVGGAPPAPPAS